MTKRNGLELTTGIITLVLASVATVLFFLSYRTGYYTYGQMMSPYITAMLIVGMIVTVAAMILRGKFPASVWPKDLTYAVTALLAGAAMLLVGDRVEGIGNCIITDYDSGHGGEEAIYLSLAAAALLLIAVIYNIIGSFAKDQTEESSKGAKIARTVGFGVSALAVLGATAGVLLPALGITVGNGGAGGASGGNGASESYTVSYNQEHENVDAMTSYQFLCSDFSGMVAADSRFYVDLKLDLDGAGKYTLFADSYVIESGKRAEIGDDTGLGLILTTNATGTYTENEDGTITTAVPDHAVFEMETDTYSSQMKQAAQMNVDGNDEDGVYDSDEVPAVLAFVPETVWTLGEGTIESYRDANAGGTYTVSFNQEFGNQEGMPDYQFLCSDFSGMVAADSRFYVDLKLDLDGAGNYTLFADSYVIESGKRAEIGDDTGLGLILTTNATGTYTENEDGTITTAVPDHAVFEMETDTYSSQMKQAAQMNVDGNDEDGVYDSDEVPAVLDFVPETVWTLDDDTDEIVSWLDPNAEDEDTESSEEETTDASETEDADVAALDVISDDGATTFTFNSDGTYRFFFESYSVEDFGTYTYEDGKLIITNANGDEVTTEGDPLKFHYVTSVSDQLAGDYIVSVADLETFLAGTAEEGEAEPLEVISDDEGTTFTFNPNGTCRFYFESYDVEDLGTYTYEDGKLTVTNANGDEVTAEGDPLKFHYVTAVSDQLAGDYTVNAADLEAVVNGEGEGMSAGDAKEITTVTSNDEATTLTFYEDGTYRFFFASYEVEDLGTYTYEDGILTLTNANKDEVTAEGDPLKFHYVTAVSDQLAGDYTLPAADLSK